MQTQYDITPIVFSASNYDNVRRYLDESKFFDERIMSHCEDALDIWQNVFKRYIKKEQALGIPYALNETPKLYALDAICIASPLVADKVALNEIAELFTVFYLMTHYFDDHVEHQDKFFSKFSFSSENNMSTQYGAAPFSFLLTSISVLEDILSESSHLSDQSRVQLIGAMCNRLAAQTRFFASERQANLSAEEALEMKARKVNGQALGVLADILDAYVDLGDGKFETLEQGLLYLGSMEQFTDDIRDLTIDETLRNANIILSASRSGPENAKQHIQRLFDLEVENARKYLLEIYGSSELRMIFSLPFYPFMIDKRKLSQTS
jgi:hypothetical protein